MKKIIIVLLSLLLSFFVTADTRSTNIDFYLLIDKSLSMVNEIQEVTQYINEEILEKLLIPGDRLLILNFYGETSLIYDEIIDSQSTLFKAKDAVSQIRADGSWTDIGTALDTLINTVDHRTPEQRDTFLLLLTDGIQEAPPWSPYYTKDASFNHALLETSRIIQKKGWRIHILGIGLDSMARKLAQELDAPYREVPTSSDPDKFSEALRKETADFLYFINLLSVKQTEKLANGLFEIELTLGSENLNNPVNIEVSRIHLEDLRNIHTSPINILLEPNETINIKIPLDIGNSDLRSGTLLFEFSSRDSFLPAQYHISLDEKTFLASNYLLFILVTLSLALIIFVVTIIRVINERLKDKEEKALKKKRKKKQGEK